MLFLYSFDRDLGTAKFGSTVGEAKAHSIWVLCKLTTIRSLLASSATGSLAIVEVSC